MNEVFEYRRFGALARKYYRENRRLGIIFLGIIGIITFLCLCKFNPFLREYTQVENPAEVSDFIQYYKGVYRQLFWGLYGLFALVVALHSLRDFVVKDKILNTLLLPASVFEKYVLAFLNSTVVLLVVYLLMFYALASVTNSYKFTGLNRLEYVSGSFGNQVPAMTPGQEVVHTEIGNVFDFSEGGYLMNISYDQKELNYGKLTNGIVVNMVVIWFLYVMSVGMWGSVTFLKHPFILTFLVHVIFLLALVAVSVWLGNKLFGAEPQMKPDELSFYGGEVLPDLPSFRWLLVFYIFPLTYQAVIWIKLKTKQVLYILPVILGFIIFYNLKNPSDQEMEKAGAYIEKLYKQPVSNVVIYNTDMAVRVIESPEKVKQGFKITGVIPFRQVTGFRVAGDTLYVRGPEEYSGVICQLWVSPGVKVDTLNAPKVCISKSKVKDNITDYGL